MRILWVENHAGFVRVAGRQFLAAHELAVVPSLTAAKESLSSGMFDVVLLDYDLDDGKGVELIPFIQQLPNTPAVIAVSAHEDGNAALVGAGAKAACAKAKFATIESVLASVVSRG